MHERHGPRPRGRSVKSSWRSAESCPCMAPSSAASACPTTRSAHGRGPSRRDACRRRGDPGVCNGGLEVGPRALGHRSILPLARLGVAAASGHEVIKGGSGTGRSRPPCAPRWHAPRSETEAAAAKSPRASCSAPSASPGLGPRFAGVLHQDGSLRAAGSRRPSRKTPSSTPSCSRSGGRTAWRGSSTPRSGGPGESMVHRHHDALPLARRLGLGFAVVVHGSRTSM